MESAVGAGSSEWSDDDDQGKRQLDDVLRSMGLRPPRTAVRGASDNSDRQRGNRESGRRSQPPAEFLEQYRDFLKSLQQEGPKDPRTQGPK